MKVRYGWPKLLSILGIPREAITQEDHNIYNKHKLPSPLELWRGSADEIEDIFFFKAEINKNLGRGAGRLANSKKKKRQNVEKIEIPRMR